MSTARRLLKWSLFAISRVALVPCVLVAFFAYGCLLALFGGAMAIDVVVRWWERL